MLFPPRIGNSELASPSGACLQFFCTWGIFNRRKWGIFNRRKLGNFQPALTFEIASRCGWRPVRDRWRSVNAPLLIIQSVWPRQQPAVRDGSCSVRGCGPDAMTANLSHQSKRLEVLSC